VRYYFLNKYLNKVFGEMPLSEWFTGGVIWVCHYFLLAAGFYYFQSSIQKQKGLRKAAEDLAKATQEKAAKEKEAAQLEIAGLRAQINPHFLFNTLAYFYSKTYQSQPDVGEGIAALSDIMRSAIRKPDWDGLIPLDEEVNNIEQLISIYQLRYNNTVFISFKQEGNTQSLRILPHVLNTLVENALKHGELHKEEYPLLIHLKIDQGNIHFSVQDKKRTGPKEMSHGIGMSYITTHLKNFYKDRYSLDIDENENFYSIALNITRDNMLSTAA
jgi:LytS/YehU family sensor histidine kinase